MIFTNSQIIILSFIFSVLLVFSNHAYAETAYKTTNYKLSHDPTICIIEPDDKNIPEAGKKLLEQTNYAILDWQTKLKDITGERHSWNFESKIIKLNEINSYDFSKCDIQIHFKDQPDKKEYKFHMDGLTHLDEKTLSPIVEIYYLQIDPGIEYKTQGKYYWYEYHPSYQNILRTDYQLSSVIRHELGHSFGLGHYMVYDKSTNDNWTSGTLTPPSVMIPLSPESTRRVDITPLDIDKMVSIYGSKGFGDKQDNESNVHTIHLPYLFKSYESEKNGFSINYPADWYPNNQNTEQSNSLVTFVDNLQYQYAYLEVSLIENNEDDMQKDSDYLDSMTQLVKDYCEGMTFETGDLECSNFMILDSKVMEINNKKAYQIKYFRVLDDSSGDTFPIINISTDIPDKNNTWLIDAWFPSLLHSDFIDEIDSSINSFKITSDETPIIANDSANSEVKPTTKNESSVKSSVPPWIKNNAKWWSDGQIDDEAFVNGIQFLINNKIISISQIPESLEQSEQKIPDWIKNNAKWWSDGQITEGDFLKGIEHLVKIGIIKVN